MAVWFILLYARHIDVFFRNWHEFRISVATMSGLFLTVYEQPFTLPHYCGIGKLPSVASAAHTIR
jgi:hypothetical protein